MRALLLTALVALLTGCSPGDGHRGPTASAPATATSSGHADPSTTTPPGAATTAPAETPPPAPAPPGPVDLAGLEVVAQGLEVPWEVAVVDDATLLVTERPGRVRVVEGGVVRPEPVAAPDVVAEGEGGLLGLALHPDFPRVRSAYLYLTTAEDNRVVRWDVADDLTFTDPEVVLDGIPRGRFHNGGRIAFGPDGMLYVATGDARRPELAPDLTSLAGKVLRLTPEGDIPPDNPFGSPIWSYGHRNPQGLAWDADGHLYASEHGPTGDLDLCCHDEVNRIRPGGFYGWPFVAGRLDVAGAGEPPAQPIAPVVASGDDTWAPAGVAVDRTADGATSLLVANLAERTLRRVVLAGPDEATSVEVVLEGRGRLRAATTGPDGCLHLTTSDTDGRGQPGPGDDQVLRACPAP